MQTVHSVNNTADSNEGILFNQKLSHLTAIRFICSVLEHFQKAVKNADITYKKRDTTSRNGITAESLLKIQQDLWLWW